MAYVWRNCVLFGYGVYVLFRKGVRFSGDVQGTLRGTNLIKNIPTFKAEHWNNIGLKLLCWGFLQF